MWESFIADDGYRSVAAKTPTEIAAVLWPLFAPLVAERDRYRDAIEGMTPEKLRAWADALAALVPVVSQDTRDRCPQCDDKGWYWAASTSVTIPATSLPGAVKQPCYCSAAVAPVVSQDKTNDGQGVTHG